MKVFKGISYSRLAEEIGVSQSSFYAWLKGQYEFSPYREEQLKDKIQMLMEE